MSIIRQWAAEYGVRIDAVVALELRLGLIGRQALADYAPTPHDEASEARQQSLIRLEAPAKGVRLFRNNSGAFKDTSGQFVRYGLANDSAALNKVLKSPDLVGWRKGGQCVLRECKPEGWQYAGNAHERAQLAFIELALADGCDAAFATGPGTL